MLQSKPLSETTSQQQQQLIESLGSKGDPAAGAPMRGSSPEVPQAREATQQGQRQQQPLDRGSRQGSPEDSKDETQRESSTPGASEQSSADIIEPAAGTSPAPISSGNLSTPPAPGGEVLEATAAPAAGSSASSESTTIGCGTGRRSSDGKPRPGRGSKGAPAVPADGAQPGGSRLARFLRTKQDAAMAAGTAAGSTGSSSREVQGPSMSSTTTGRGGDDHSTGTMLISAAWPVGEAIKNLRAVCEIQAKYWPVLEDFTARWQAYERRLQGARRRTG